MAVSVEAPGDPLPRGGSIARERVIYGEPVACRQPREDEAVEALQSVFLETPYRPTGLSTASTWPQPRSGAAGSGSY